ncbi:MAG: pseudouridine synthase [Pseudomonadales bacterium]|nr:pseudouridine synthase [Pseudomonadales bacterium]
MNDPTETLPILFEDEHYIAVHKPAGLLVHRSPVDRRETRFAIQILRDQIGHYVYPAHRLDKPTSGILLFTKSKDALTLIRDQFESQSVTKVYQALVRGHTPDSLKINHPVKTRKDKLDAQTLKTPKNAETLLNTLAKCVIPVNVESYPTSRYSLVALTPITGRRHQLRYHMKHISHPIIGDANYGKGVQNRYFQQHLHCHRLMLAATQLSFFHPYEHQQQRIDCPPAADFLNTLKQLPFPKTEATNP